MPYRGLEKMKRNRDISLIGKEERRHIKENVK
jgi:hypothetical protein